MSYIERLRESKAQQDKEDSDFGIRCGTEWARQYANYAELSSLAENDYSGDETMHDLESLLEFDVTESITDAPSRLYQSVNFADGFLTGATRVYLEAFPEAFSENLRTCNTLSAIRFVHAA